MLLTRAHIASLVLCLATPALAADKPAAAPAAQKGKQTYGKPFTTAAAVPVADVMAASDKFEGKSVKMTGTVSKVCQKKGCWFELAPTAGGRGVRIKSADYTIFVPMDSAGRTATVEGTFSSKTMNEAEAKHMAEDGAKAGEKPAEVKGPVKEFQMAAVAVELN
ncbi:MAG: DUF4920 domain-containing protein [Myxococcota bacterium]